MRLLSELLPVQLPDAISEMKVSGLALDNRQIKSGMAFVALQGTRQHGLVYAKTAVDSGAVVVLYEPAEGIEPPDLTVPVLAVNNLGVQLGNIAAEFYNFPSRKMDVIGVTGTDGKTSVTHFIAEALQALNKPSAVIGTIGIGRPGNLQPATHTTPDVINVHANLQELHATGLSAVAMEVSSHALDQGRVNAVDFDIAVLTNLTRDHLDYHVTEEAYAEAKQKLFFWPDLKAVVLNLDDDFGRRLAEELGNAGCQVVGYGVGDAADYPVGSIVATNAVFDHNGIQAKLTSGWGAGELTVSVLGRFNLDNLLATLAVLLIQGYELGVALKAIKTVNTVPGRMERVSVNGVNKDLLTVVDYAHTSGALSSVLSAVRVHTRKQLICVFGCGGDRDAGKRPLMARVAEQVADQVIVTDDNPRTEDPERIFLDIRKGFEKPGQIYFEHDRAIAIHHAIHQAQSGDTVLIAGKGHETVQIVNQENRPFDDREQARAALQECAV
ncbi:MAG: UDP-N-acetylmuramoyl-L-alanyl-D-glutamate--2,6-diaminopimelate ligase [Thiolinea sp.]